MTLGLVLLTVALIDAIIMLLRGGVPSYEAGEAQAGAGG